MENQNRFEQQDQNPEYRSIELDIPGQPKLKLESVMNGKKQMLVLTPVDDEITKDQLGILMKTIIQKLGPGSPQFSVELPDEENTAVARTVKQDKDDMVQ
jgi:hypothetical protein